MRVRILPNPPRACSSDRRAPALQAGGRECNPRRVHQVRCFSPLCEPLVHFGRRPVKTVQVYSSTGRASGSYPGGWGFDALWACQVCPCSPIGRGSRLKTGPVKVRILPRAPKFQASLAELAYAAVLETVRSRFESWAGHQVQREESAPSLGTTGRTAWRGSGL